MSAQEHGGYMGRTQRARLANDRIVRRAEQLRFVSRVPLLCECGDAGCAEIVLVWIREYWNVRNRSKAQVIAPGHQLGARVVERRV